MCMSGTQARQKKTSGPCAGVIVACDLLHWYLELNLSLLHKLSVHLTAEPMVDILKIYHFNQTHNHQQHES